MGKWADQFKDHAVFKHLDSWGPAIERAKARENLDPQAIEDLARLASVLEFTGKRLAACDPYLVVPALADALSNQVQQAANETANFAANGAVGHLNQANVAANSILSQLPQFLLPLTSEEFQAAQSAAYSYRDSLNQTALALRQQSSEVSTEADGTRQKLVSLSADFTAEKQRLDTLAAQFQSQFSDAQATREAQHSAAQALREERFSTLTADYTSKLAEKDAEAAKQLTTLSGKHEAELQRLNEQFIEKAKVVLTEIRGRKDEVEKLTQIIGNVGVAAGYQKEANEAKVTARFWQGVTVVALLGVFALAAFAFLPALSGGFSWSSLVSRTVVTLTVFALAIYGASQADRYQKVERHSRSLALQLEALGPFIAAISETKQEEFRVAFGERTFGQESDPVGGSRSPATLLHGLKSKEFRETVELLTKLAAAFKG